LIFIPERRRGAYAPPGWTGNGIEPWGLAPDPIGADGNLFFRGFFNLLLGVYSYVSGDDKYRRPFPVTGYLDRQFTWTHQDIASFISQQLADRPEGPHCENTKVWPFCISAAGLGLKLYDAVHDTTLQRPYDSWTEFAQKYYMGLDRRGELDWFAFYYDPLAREVCSFPDSLTAYASLCITPYVFPQNPGFATDLYEKSCRLLGWSNAKARVNQFVPDPRFLSIGLLMAREIGDTTTESRLREVVERDFQPRSFGDESDRFGFFFDWGEPYPRGQPSALLMLTEVGEPGAWSRVFNQPNLDKFHEPTVEGIDYPTLGVSTARNVRHSGELHVDTYAATPSRSGRSTTWRVTQLPDSSTVRITCDGADFTRWRVLGQHGIELTTSVGDHSFSIRTGYHGEPVPRLAGSEGSGSEGSGSEGSSLGGFGSGGSSSGGFGSGQPGDTRSATDRGVAPTVRGARPRGSSASTGPCGCC
jgi:uncharacterized membrane protein YgcG